MDHPVQDIQKFCRGNPHIYNRIISSHNPIFCCCFLISDSSLSLHFWTFSFAPRTNAHTHAHINVNILHFFYSLVRSQARFFLRFSVLILVYTHLYFAWLAFNRKESTFLIKLNKWKELYCMSNETQESSEVWNELHHDDDYAQAPPFIRHARNKRATMRQKISVIHKCVVEKGDELFFSYSHTNIKYSTSYRRF